MKKLFFFFVLLAPHFLLAQNIYNILSYGAVADSTTNNSLFIQKAIDECYSKGGGTVFVPAGKFMTGSINLKSNINLYLDAGATLIGSNSVADYPSIGMSSEQRNNSLITAINANNITISGHGTIDGNGKSFVTREPHPSNDFDRKLTRQKEQYMTFRTPSQLPPDGPYAMLPRPGVLILLINCSNVLLQDFMIADAPNWCLHLGGCRYVNIASLNIINSLFIPNADGIDASNCAFVNINNCNIVAGDDGIAVSPCADGYCSKPSEYYTVSNCNIVSRSAGIRVGYGTNDIHDIVFQNMNIQSNRGIGLFVRQHQHIENILFSNMVIKTAFMDGPWWGNADPVHISVVPATADTAGIGDIRNITFSQINMESENGIDIYSFSPGHIKNIAFDGIDLFIKSTPLTRIYGGNFDLRPAYSPELKIFEHDIAGLYAYQVTGITIHNMKLNWEGSLPGYYTNGIWLQKSYFSDIQNFDGKPAPDSKGERILLEPGKN
jgi:polygalacturonase